MVVLQLDTGQELDIMNGIPMSLNYSIADVREPNKRNSAFSKTIMLPGSDNNNNILQHVYEIDIDGGFNPNIRQVISVLKDGITQLDGFMQLLEIVTEDKQVIYKIAIFGDNGDFMSTIEGVLLSDINFSDLNHTLNLTNIRASWDTTKGENYMYPLVDNGFTDGTTWQIAGFAPAIYVKEYIDRIFANSTYTFTSTFFDSDYFKSLIIPYTNGQLKLSDGAQQDKLYQVDMNSTYFVPNSGVNKNKIVWDVVTADTGNNGTVLEYTVPTDGSYSFNTKLVSLTRNTAPTVAIRNFRSGAGAFSGGFVDYLTVGTVGVPYNSNYHHHFDSTLPFLKGDVVTVVVFSDVDAGSSFAAGSFFRITCLNTGLQDSDTVNMNLIAPDMKQTEFFMNLVKMHNLYVSPDPLNNKNLLIEPREDFYGISTVDWTNKLDRSQALTITPLGELGGRKYTFSYKEDKDYYNKIYQQKYEEASGTRTLYSTNQFLKNEVKTDITFSPSIIFGDRWNGNEPFRYPYYIDDNIYNTPVPDGFTTNVKILMYGGRQAAPIWYTETGGIKTVAESGFGFYSYPFCSHLDSPTIPTVDISFGAPKMLFTAYSSYTNNNLYNKYWSKFIEEILDPNSKVVTGRFLLNAADINALDFSKQYLVDNHLLRLNSVKNYDPTKNSSLCTVEFVKIKEAAEFSAATTSSYGGIKKEL